MTITAREVITAARDEHMAFSPTRSPNAMLLRQLVSYKRRLFQRITDVNSSVLQDAATDVAIDILTFDFATGHDIGDYIYVLPDGEIEPQNELDPGDRSKFYLIGQSARLFSRPALSGWIRGTRLFLQGSAQDWSGFLFLHLSIIPQPTGPTALDDDFDPLPDSGRDVLVSYLARFMAKRGHADPSLPPIDTTTYQAEHLQRELQFLTEMGLRKKANRIKTLDTFPAGP